MASCCRPRSGLVLAALTTLTAGGLAAQQQPTSGSVKVIYELTATTGEIRIDGVMDEPAWLEALEVSLAFEVFPAENTPAPVETDCRLTYDTRSFYLGCNAFDPEPGAIRAHLSDRDTAWRDDFLGIIVDTFNDERRAFEFFVNPLGVQMDLVRNDVATGGNQEDPSWDAIWSSAGNITANGYVVELAIPFTSLRFQRVSGEQVWGFSLFRSYPRSVRHELFSHPYDRNLNCSVCQSEKLRGFAGVQPGRNLEINPTLTGSKVDEREEIDDPELVEGEVEPELGLTVTWGVTPNMTLAGTLNPDFSQVEADAAQLAVNNQFTLFFPEKRPFFLEGADFFETFFRTVHTRVVADPAWGLKVTGKPGRNAIGIFAAEDDVTNILLPGSEGSEVVSLEESNLSAVARYRRDLGATSTLGIMVTAREAEEYRSHLAGVDGLFRLTDRDSLHVEALTSSTQYPQEILDDYGEEFRLRAGAMDDEALFLEYRHDTRNWFGRLLYQNVGEDFRADLGFLPQVDFERYDAFVERTWWGEEEDWYSFFEIGGRWQLQRNQRGELLRDQGEVFLNISGPLQSFLRVNPEFGKRGFEGETFDENILGLFFEIQPAGGLILGLRSRVGETVDFDNAQQAEQVDLRPFVDWNAGRHLRLGLHHNYRSLDVEGGRLFTADLSEVRAVYQFNIRTFLRAIVQRLEVERDPSLYDDEVDAETADLFVQLLLSYKLNPRTVFFLGYSEGREGNEVIDPTTTSRTVFVKLGYAWVK